MKCRPIAVVVLITALWSATEAANPAPSENPLATCRAISGQSERLACYDAITTKLSAPRFEGRLTATTERFTITAPHVLSYESDGPIFVMYLRNDAGDVVQNLHIGGGGQQSYVIEHPGTYFLTISGSETWRVWLDPK